jgi:ribosomal protein S12 methylthiotransferase accessory factor
MMPSPHSQLPPHRPPADICFRYPFGSLVQPHVGLIEGVRFLPIEIGEPVIEVTAATLGNVSMALPYLGAVDSPGGGGSDVDPDVAWIRAVVETAERYASMVYAEGDFVVATAKELGPDALDLLDIPRCSREEQMDPKCPVVPPRDDVPIRWLRGYSLVHQRERLVPAVMTHLHVAAICENIERDAIALTWLGRLPLPRIERQDPVPVVAAATFERVDASGLKYYNFDATTDLGIPTVFSVQVADGHPYCALSVSCATELDPEEAQVKALREACSGRLVMNKPHEIPSRVIDFHRLTHGAHYYGLGGHRADFDFLLRGASATTTIAAMWVQTLPSHDKTDYDRLAFLITRLRDLGLDAIAVDLSTDELREVGLWVVRVIIPQLMPISFVQRARYLGTPRLYEYVGRVKQCEFTEADVNAAPLPFA